MARRIAHKKYGASEQLVNKQLSLLIKENLQSRKISAEHLIDHKQDKYYHKEAGKMWEVLHPDCQALLRDKYIGGLENIYRYYSLHEDLDDVCYTFPIFYLVFADAHYALLRCRTSCLFLSSMLVKSIGKSRPS